MREASSRPVSADWQLQMIGEAWWMVFKGPVWRGLYHLLVRMLTAGIVCINTHFSHITTLLCQLCHHCRNDKTRVEQHSGGLEPRSSQLQRMIHVSNLPHTLNTVLQSVFTSSVCLIIWRNKILCKSIKFDSSISYENCPTSQWHAFMTVSSLQFSNPFQ